jgi:Protein of unknown function (DUF2934)
VIPAGAAASPVRLAFSPWLLLLASGVFVAGATVAIWLGRNLLAELARVLGVLQTCATADIHFLILRCAAFGLLESLCRFVLQTDMAQRRRTDHAAKRNPIRDAIATFAYERFLGRGRQHGYDLEDWLAAEREFVSRQMTPVDRSRVTPDLLGAPGDSSMPLRAGTASAATRTHES